ncbi:MAG TPA: von Willebrand factor type A domain-containing protein, partial [Burkholderiales bacterium]|nr:von Willebrand factor type A domain-containing protein [Burkholderiales bacterium]
MFTTSNKRLSAFFVFAVAFVLILAGCESGTAHKDSTSRDSTASPQVTPAGAPVAQAPADASRIRREAGLIAGNSLTYSPYYPPIPPSADKYPDVPPSGVMNVAEQPVSTFSVDVDTASYAFVRRQL